MQLAQEIETMLDTDLDQGQQLLVLLKQETTAIKQRNFELMEQLLSEKAPLMEQLKNNGMKRIQWLQTVKKTHSTADWDFILTQLKLEHLSERWQANKALMAQCQAVNTTNGQLVHRGLKCNERLSNILQGNTDEETLYNAKGLQKTANKALTAYASA